MNKLYLLPFAMAALGAQAERVAWIPMDLKNGSLTEICSGSTLELNGIRVPASAAGARGAALRFDGYSHTASGMLPELLPAGNKSATFSVWVAPQTYPMMSLDTPSSEGGLIIGNLDKDSKSGFAFRLTRDGEVAFETYGGGWPISVKSEEKVPRSKWTRLTAVLDGDTRELTLWFNDRKVASGKCTNSISIPALTMYVGGDAVGSNLGPFRIDTFNGLIDDFEIQNQAIVPTAEVVAENPADTSIVSGEVAAHPWRPLFHAMPADCWMNESHGLAYSGGKYHLFFQKNGNGPYMSRLHWGHLVSEDLCEWQELPVAIAPETSYDTKGCWSGCVFTDAELTAGRPQIFYTAVDYARARVATAKASDDSLTEWSKPEQNPLLDGRPDGLSDDFRDCFLFRNGDNLYMIVGTSKDNRGAATLHRYDSRTATWSNNGDLFFQAGNASVAGRFWEMPNVTKIGDKWLFTVTPLDMTGGVQCLYWVGDINEDGTFSPISPLNQPGHFELAGFAKDGFGLLSPSIMQKDGKTIAMGIVPDKLPSEENYNMGWAHNISMPRELSISSDNRLLQRPYSGLQDLRSSGASVNLSSLGTGSVPTGLNATRFDMVLEFEKGNGAVGFDFFKNADGKAQFRYDQDGNKIIMDLRGLPRVSNDGWLFNGYYEASLPESYANGTKMKVEVIVDGSIAEIFVNDSYAASVRIFPSSDNADGIELVSDMPVSGTLWKLEGKGGSGIGELAGQKDDTPVFRVGEGEIGVDAVSGTGRLCVWNLSGALIGEASGAGCLSVRSIDKGPVVVTLQVPGQPVRTAKLFIR